MARPTTTNYGLKKGLASDPLHSCGLDEVIGPIMDQNLDAIDAAIAAAGGGVANAGSKKLYVDGSRSDSYSADGSVAKPFKTIAAVVAQIVANGDGPTQPYHVVLNPAVYNEAVTLNSGLIGSILFSASGALAGQDIESHVKIAGFSSTSNNTGLAAKFEGIYWNGALTMTGSGGEGSSGGNPSLFCGGCFFSGSGTLTATQCTVNLSHCYIQATMTFADVDGTWWNVDARTGTFSLSATIGSLIVWDNVVNNMNITVGNLVTLSMSMGCYCSSSGSITVQSGGTLSVRNGYIRGTLTIQAGGTINANSTLIESISNSGTLAAAGAHWSATKGLTGAAQTVASGQVSLGATHAASATAGAATLPANPVGFLIINVDGTAMKVPYYNT